MADKSRDLAPDRNRCIPGNQNYIHNQTADELEARFAYEESMMAHAV